MVEVFGHKKRDFLKKKSLIGWKTGFEPATPGTTNQCSNQLSYIHRIALLRCKYKSFFIIAASFL